MHATTHSHYRGRFAPSPTGPLHLGSLIAALASYLDARHNRGTWLVRMEDLDPPREVEGASELILNSLQHHGLHWDEEVLFQSNRSAAYAAALDKLAAANQLFSCDCSRARMGPNGVCSGDCRMRQESLSAPTATRISVPIGCHIRFTDQVQGKVDAALGKELPDFVVRRKDGLNAYQLAVVIDDDWQSINHIVRGSDLLGSTARQIFMQQAMGCNTPRYSHIPLITDTAGHKFSKQTHAPAVDDLNAPANLRAALAFLRQMHPPAELDTTAQILRFACQQWAPGRIPQVLSIAAAGSA